MAGCHMAIAFNYESPLDRDIYNNNAEVPTVRVPQKKEKMIISLLLG